jgi:hypothetical protein
MRTFLAGSPRWRRLAAAAVVLVLMAGVGAVVGLAPYDVQILLLLLMVTLVGAAYLIPRAVAREPSVTVPLLALALAVKLGGTVMRFVMLELVFQGGDAHAYHLAGVTNYHLVRALDFSFIQDPYFGTDFLEDSVAFVYAVTGPSMAGGFLVFSMLSFVGTWLFYRAHRIAFPDGDSRLYFLVLFFLPTMAFWPSSLGKDSLIVFGLGLGTYGVARLLQRVSPSALLQMAIGVAVAFGVRPAVGVMFLFGAGVAFLAHPGRLRSPLARPITLVFVGPLVAVALVASLEVASTYEKLPNINSAVEEYVATRERLLESGGSEISGPAPTTPAGFGQAVFTVLFRPLPWELSDPLAVIAGLESVVIVVLVLGRLGPGARALRRRWRGGMVLMALIVSLSLIVPLTAVSNFGLLVRQRAQLLPFLFMVLTAVQRSRRTASRPAVQPAQAAATSG